MARQPVEVWGLNEIDKALKLLPQSLQYKFVQDTYANVLTTTVVKKAKMLVPKANPEWDLSGPNLYESRVHTAGNLQRALGVVRGKNKKFPIVFAGIRSKKAGFKGGPNNKDDGWYAHMVEFGHWMTNKKTRKSGQQKKLYYIPPKPFMRPAWDQSQGIVTNQIGVAFGKQVVRFLKRMTNKQTMSR